MFPLMSGSPLTRRQLYENIRAQLETERSSFISMWRSLNDYLLPTRARFQITDRNRGDRRSQLIIDGTATLSARTLASGMMSGITSPARPWFRLSTPDPDLAEFGAVKQWLHVTTERMRWVLGRSNFYNKCPTLYGDLGVFGTGALMEVEDDHSIVRFVDFPIGSYSVANGSDDRPAVVTRAFSMSVRQLITEFGIDNVSQMVRDNWRRNTNSEAWIDVAHIVHRNDQYDMDGLRASENKQWQSAYYEIGGTNRISGTSPEMLRVSGFEEMPFMVPVWETTGEDVYGTSCPGIIALGDVRQLQNMERRGLQGLEKMVNPPMTGPTSLMSVKASILPGDITYVDTRDGMQGFRAAHETMIRLDQLEAKENGVRYRIKEAFFEDLFRMMAVMDDQREGRGHITAAEIYERHEEKLLVLGPVLEQLNNRMLDPVIHRTFSIMARRGLIPQPPPDLAVGSLKIEYISMMHQAQKSSQMGGYNTLLDFTKGAAEIDPSVVDKINMDKLIEHVSDSAGNPPDVIKSQDEVDKIRQARAQQQQAKEQAEQMSLEADTAQKLAAADTTKRSALTDVMSNVSMPGSPLGGGNGILQ